MHENGWRKYERVTRLVAPVPAQSLSDGGSMCFSGCALIVAVTINVHLACSARHLQQWLALLIA